MADPELQSALEIGHNGDGQVVVNLPTGGHLLFSPEQARTVAGLLVKRADFIDSEIAKMALNFMDKKLPGGEKI